MTHQFPLAATFLLCVKPNNLIIVFSWPHFEAELVLGCPLVVSGVEPVDPIMLELRFRDGEAVVRVDED